jgi:hypothetical protein
VEHSCKQCGTTVEDGVPFCPNCGTPQIRVAIAREEPETQPAPGISGSDSDSESDYNGEQPAAEAIPARRSNPVFGPADASQSDKYERRVVIFSALAAGFAAGIGSLVPFVPFITLCMVAAGGIAITFYKRRMPYVSVPARRGFRIGALAGFFGFLLNALTSVLGMFSAGNRGALRDAMQERLKEALSVNSDPSAQQMVKNLGEMVSTPSGLAAVFAFSLCLFGLLFVFLSGVGGAIGAALFGKKLPR